MSTTLDIDLYIFWVDFRITYIIIIFYNFAVAFRPVKVELFLSEFECRKFAITLDADINKNVKI